MGSISRRAGLLTLSGPGAAASPTLSGRRRPRDYSATAAEAVAAAAATATGIPRGSVSASLRFTSFHLAGARRRLRSIMPIAIIALHLALISAGICLLTLLCSTGNFWRYPGAGVWLCLDLMVSIAGVAFSAHPEYPALIPRLALFHFAAMAACIAWMGVDAARGAEPLSSIFFAAFGAYGVLRAGEAVAYATRTLPPAAIEIANAIGYAMVVALLIAALLLPVPPAPAHDQPGIGPFLGDPAPAMTITAASEARQ